MSLRREHARIALAAIRLVNGTLALLAPEVMLRRLGADPRTNQVAVYPLRMFGIRTVVLGVELLPGGPMQHKGKVGVVIHAADAASAITAGLRRQLPHVDRIIRQLPIVCLPTSCGRIQVTPREDPDEDG